MAQATRLELERALNTLCEISENIIAIWEEQGHMVTTPKTLGLIREAINILHARLDACKLKLWYPLPHLVPGGWVNPFPCPEREHAVAGE
jgi:hypothetical protein